MEFCFGLKGFVAALAKTLVSAVGIDIVHFTGKDALLNLLPILGQKQVTMQFLKQ